MIEAAGMAPMTNAEKKAAQRERAKKLGIKVCKTCTLDWREPVYADRRPKRGKLYCEPCIIAAKERTYRLRSKTPPS